MIILLLAILATYRLAYDITRMDGPFEVYVKLRGWFIQRFGEGHWVAEGVNCPICCSFWVSLPISLAALIGDANISALLWPLYWLGVAGGALTLIKGTTK